MSGKFWLIILFNVLIGLLFLLFNVYLWTGYGIITMDIFTIIAHNKMDSAFWTAVPNFLFWLFWVSTAVNLLFIVNLKKKTGRELVENRTGSRETEEVKKRIRRTSF